MGSLLEDLRAMAQAVEAAAEPLELTILGSGGRLAVGYLPPIRDKLDAVLSAYSFGRALSADEEMQLLVDCCDSVLRADPDTGETSPYDDEGPLRFDDSDPRWAAMVEVINEVSKRRLRTPRSARECVQVLFRLDLQPLAASSHAQTIIPWLQGIRAESMARVEGKSEGAARDDAAGS